MAVVLEGAPVVMTHDDGRVEIVQAPPIARIALELLCAADPVVLRVTGRLITLAGQVVYRVIGWDDHGQALIAELAEDRRPVVASPIGRTSGRL